MRSHAKAFNFASVSCDNLRPSEYEILAATFLVERMPGITVLTASWLSVKRRANSARLPASSPDSDLSRSTRSKTFCLRSPRKNRMRKSFSGKTLSGRIAPVNPPSSNGTRAMTPTVQLLADGIEFVLRRLLEDVVDHLHGVDVALAQRLDRVRMADNR